jgi:hypothetical protein
MSEEQSGGSSPWKWVGIGCGVLALVGACMLASCVACGGVGAVGIFAAIEAPANEAKGLLADVRGQRWDAAYGRMSTGYRATHDVAAFTAQVQAIPAMTTMTDDTISQRNVSGSTARMSGTLQTPTGDVPVSFELSQLGERWVVDRIDVAGATIP